MTKLHFEPIKEHLTAWQASLSGPEDLKSTTSDSKDWNFGPDSESEGTDTESGKDSTLEEDFEEKAMAAIARGKALVGAGTFGSPVNSDKYKRTRRISFKFPPGYKVTRNDLRRLQDFQDLPFVSPYSDSSKIPPDSPLAEKRTVAVIHEILSLTVEKRMLCDHFTHFRRPFRCVSGGF